jgi:hypothetical protein
MSRSASRRRTPAGSSHVCLSVCVDLMPLVNQRLSESRRLLDFRFPRQGFAFYLQPMLMPLLHEMPAGAVGVRILSIAVDVVVLGAAAQRGPEV